MSELVDTTQMYLKSIYELLEDGVAPMRARIVERLGQSGPTVSQTTARLERDGLVRVDDDRRIILTELGMQEATEVIRKHRLAECLLTEVIGMNWEDAHEEACRWEHVMSNQVDELLQPLLNQPSTDPYGNRIPARVYSKADFSPALLGQSLDDLTPHDVEQPVEIWRIGEPAQAYPGLLPKMAAAKMLPGSQVTISFVSGGKIAALTSDFTQNTAENHPRSVEIHADVFKHFFVKTQQK